MGIKLANNVSATVPAAVSSVATSLSVSSGQGALFPTLGGSDYFFATLVSSAGTIEIIKVTARTDDAMTVVRAQEGTLAVPFPANSRLEMRITVQSVLDAVSEAAVVAGTINGGTY